MDRFLSTVFPCCFPNRHASRSSSGEHNERTPLLNDAAHSTHGSSRASLNESGIATPGSDTKRLKNKQSVLPAPAYDAHVLRNIIDDFKGKLIAVDTKDAGGESSSVGALLSDSGRIATPRTEGSGEKHFTPVHTLRLSISSTSQAPAPRLVDIWSDPPPPEPAAQPSSSSTILSYSAAVKRGQAGRKRGAKATQQAKEMSVEQKTYEALSEMVGSKPLVHDWVLDDENS